MALVSSWTFLDLRALEVVIVFLRKRCKTEHKSTIQNGQQVNGYSNNVAGDLKHPETKDVTGLSQGLVTEHSKFSSQCLFVFFSKLDFCCKDCKARYLR